MLQNVLLVILFAAPVVLAPVERSFNTWKEYGGGVDGSQYSSLKQINKSNVRQLEVAWTFQTGGTALTNPLVVDVVLYVPKSGVPAVYEAGDANSSPCQLRETETFSRASQRIHCPQRGQANT